MLKDEAVEIIAEVLFDHAAVRFGNCRCEWLANMLAESGEQA